jgi:acetyl/propionyl-CoA carboxylase alpha subunit
VEVVTVDEAGKTTISVYSDKDWAALIVAAGVLGVR